jgi:mannosyltransferase
MPLSEAHVEQQESVLGPPKTPSTWLDAAVLVGLMGIGSALRFSHLTAKPFWFDECFSVELARLQFGSFVRMLWWREATATLFNILLRVWLHFGGSEFFIRSLSVLCAVATIPATYWLARQLYDRRIALLAAALFTFNAFNVRYAQEARTYALFVLLATLSSGFFVAWLREPKRSRRIVYIAVSILAIYAHFYALMLVAAEWVAFRLFCASGPKKTEPNDSNPWRAQPWRAIGIAILPLFVFIARAGAGPIRWIQRPRLHDLLTFWRAFTGGSNWLLPSIALLACLAAVGFGRRIFRASQGWETWRIQFLLMWFVAPIALTFGLSFLRPMFLPRYVIFCQPALIILMAAGIAQLKKMWLIIPALALMLLLAVQGIFFVYGHDYDDQRDGSSAAVNYILDHSQPGDGIVFHISEARAPYEFFRSLRAGENTASPKFTGQLGPDILYPHFGPGLDYSDFKAKPVPEILRSTFPSHSRIWVMFMYNQGRGAGRITEMLTHLLSQSFPDRQCSEFPKVEVCLYSKP